MESMESVHRVNACENPGERRQYVELFAVGRVT